MERSQKTGEHEQVAALGRGTEHPSTSMSTVSSGYAAREGAWKLMFHPHKLLDGGGPAEWPGDAPVVPRRNPPDGP